VHVDVVLCLADHYVTNAKTGLLETAVMCLSCGFQQ
jgi:hypothetical protein